MKKYITGAIKHPLISGSAIIFIGTNAANVLNLLFNIFMTRNLSPVHYGMLASIVAFFTLLSLPAASMIPTIVNFAATFYAEQSEGKVLSLLMKLSKVFIGFSIVLLILAIIAAPFIGKFLQIDDHMLILLACFTVALGYISTVNTGLLQAKLAFTFISITTFISTALKLALGIILVFSGFSVFGAVLALTISYIFTYILSFIPLRPLFRKVRDNDGTSIKELLVYGAPAGIATFCLTSLTSIDLILVKHFFDPKSAGLYAGLSLMGRIVFFFSSPIGVVMFPLITQKYMKKEKYHSIFYLSIFLVLLPSVLILLFYLFFPTFVISFFNKQYLPVTWLLSYFAVYMTIYSVLYIVVNFYLSVRKTFVFIPLVIGSILQIILILLFHDSFLHVILISLGISTLLLLSLLLYLELYDKRKRD